MVSKAEGVTVSEFNMLAEHIGSEDFRIHASTGQYTNDNKKNVKRICELMGQLMKTVGLDRLENQDIFSINAAFTWIKRKVKKNIVVPKPRIDTACEDLGKIIFIVSKYSNLFASPAHHKHSKLWPQARANFTPTANVHPHFNYESDAKVSAFHAGASTLKSFSTQSSNTPLINTRQRSNTTSVNSASDSASMLGSPRSSAPFSRISTSSNTKSDSVSIPTTPGQEYRSPRASTSSNTGSINSTPDSASMLGSPRSSASSRPSTSSNTALVNRVSDCASRLASPRSNAPFARVSTSSNTASVNSTRNSASMLASPRSSISLSSTSQSSNATLVGRSSDCSDMSATPRSSVSITRTSTSSTTTSVSRVSDIASMPASPRTSISQK